VLKIIIIIINLLYCFPDVLTSFRPNRDSGQTMTKALNVFVLEFTVITARKTGFGIIYQETFGECLSTIFTSHDCFSQLNEQTNKQTNTVKAVFLPRQHIS